MDSDGNTAHIINDRKYLNEIQAIYLVFCFLKFQTGSL